MRAKKCNVFFEKDLQAWCDSLGQHETSESIGITFALEFAKAIMWMCLTGKKFGHSEGDIEKLPVALRNCHKFFLGGWEESNMLMAQIRKSTRVEILIGFNIGPTVRAKATFFRKGRLIIGHHEVTFDFATGRLMDTGLSLSGDFMMMDNNR